MCACVCVSVCCVYVCRWMGRRCTGSDEGNFPLICVLKDEFTYHIHVKADRYVSSTQIYTHHHARMPRIRRDVFVRISTVYSKTPILLTKQTHPPQVLTRPLSFSLRLSLFSNTHRTWRNHCRKIMVRDFPSLPASFRAVSKKS